MPGLDFQSRAASRVYRARRVTVWLERMPDGIFPDPPWLTERARLSLERLSLLRVVDPAPATRTLRLTPMGRACRDYRLTSRIRQPIKAHRQTEKSPAT